MSASKHKRERQELYAGGEDPRQVQHAAKKSAAKRTVVISVAALAIAFFCIAVVVLSSTTFLQTHTTAVKVGSHRISPAMFNFYYRTEYYDLCDSYGDSLSDYIDVSKPLTEQYQDAAKAITWSEFLTDRAVSKIQEAYSVYDSAVAAGHALSESEQAAFDTLSDTIDAAATSAGYENDPDGLIASMYGTGCTKELYLEYEQVRRLAASYAAAYTDAIQVPQADIDAYYAQHRDEFDTVSYRLYNCLVKNQATGTVDEEASRQQAQEMAELSFRDEDRYIDLTRKNSSQSLQDVYADPDVTLQKNVQYSAVISEELRAWLTDERRAAGDTTCFQSATDGSYNVIYFVERNTQDYSLVNIRDVFFAFEESTDSPLYGYATNAGDKEYTQESKDSAKTLSEKAMNNFLLTDRSEAAFIEIVKTYSDDANAKTTEGLYENYEKGTLPPEVDAWAYDANRKVGDFISVASNKGYYMLYFSGLGENCRNHMVAETLRQQQYEQWYTSSASALTASVKGGIRYANR